jgi:hypothetical protein
MFWDKYTLVEESIFKWMIGNSIYYVLGIGKEIKVAKISTDDINGTNHFEKIGLKELPDNLSWRSFITDKVSSFILHPSMPNRPLVIRTEHDIIVLPAKSLVLYVKIPVWAGFYVHSPSPDNLLLEDSTLELSSTWFGPPDNGVLSYSLYNPVELSLDNIKVNDFEVICSLKISNESSQSLKLKRISLEVDRLKIYSGDLGLCTNEVKIKYKGQNSLSDTSFGKQAPAFLKEPKLLTSERDPSSKNILRKSFDFLITSTINL